MVVTINMSIPESCASCPLSVRLFGKLYCPPLDGRVGNEGKDSRCPLVDAEGRGDLISRQAAITEFNCCELTPDGGIDANYAIEFLEMLPSAQPNVHDFPKDADCISRQQAIDALIEWYGCEPSDIGAFENIIEKLPSAQSDIIRCKDCKYYGRTDKRRFYRGMDCLNKHIATIVPDRDFCSYAERRTDEAN